MQVLNTEYASVAEPLVAFIDELCERHDKQIVVLIPVVLPDRLRYEFLHNHYDLVLSARCAATPMSSAPGSRCPWNRPMATTPPAPGDMECRAAGGRLGSAVD